MEKSPIEADSWWTHKRLGYSVQIEQLSWLKVKSDDAANWSDAVAYQRSDEDESPIYVRTLSDFRAKFEQDERLGDEE